MNAKTAKLIRRYSTVMGFPHRVAKRGYLIWPKTMRFAAKQEMRGKIYDSRNA